MQRLPVSRSSFLLLLTFWYHASKHWYRPIFINNIAKYMNDEHMQPPVIYTFINKFKWTILKSGDIRDLCRASRERRM
jgi:hypothetical protein